MRRPTTRLCYPPTVRSTCHLTEGPTPCCLQRMVSQMEAHRLKVKASSAASVPSVPVANARMAFVATRRASAVAPARKLSPVRAMERAHQFPMESIRTAPAGQVAAAAPSPHWSATARAPARRLHLRLVLAAFSALTPRFARARVALPIPNVRGAIAVTGPHAFPRRHWAQAAEPATSVQAATA